MFLFVCFPNSYSSVSLAALSAHVVVSYLIHIEMQYALLAALAPTVCGSFLLNSQSKMMQYPLLAALNLTMVQNSRVFTPSIHDELWT